MAEERRTSILKIRREASSEEIGSGSSPNLRRAVNQGRLTVGFSDVNQIMEFETTTSSTETTIADSTASSDQSMNSTSNQSMNSTSNLSMNSSVESSPKTPKRSKIPILVTPQRMIVDMQVSPSPPPTSMNHILVPPTPILTLEVGLNCTEADDSTELFESSIVASSTSGSPITLSTQSPSQPPSGMDDLMELKEKLYSFARDAATLSVYEKWGFLIEATDELAKIPQDEWNEIVEQEEIRKFLGEYYIEAVNISRKRLNDPHPLYRGAMRRLAQLRGNE